MSMVFTLRKTSFRVACRTMKQLEKDPLDQWKASIRSLISSINPTNSDLSSPTRDGSRKPFREPQSGTPLPFGHHLAFFHARRPGRLLRAHGTDGDIYFTPATVLETNVGGERKDNMECKPFIIGKPTKSIPTVSSREKKGDQTIQCGAVMETSLEWSVSSKYSTSIQKHFI